MLPDPIEDEEHKSLEKRNGPYQKLTFQIKKQILEFFIDFKANRPKLDGKPKSLNEFCRENATKFNSKESTIKSFINNYEKNPVILVQLELLCSNEKNSNRHGQINKRPPQLTHNRDTDVSLADWVYCSIDLGYLVTRELIKTKAKEMISNLNPDFKASDSWLQCFLDRNNISLRKLTEKSKLQMEQYQTISRKFRAHIRDKILKHNIQPEYIINFDETPFFWDYLPRKVATPKLSKSATDWKRGYHKSRSTLCLAITAAGDFLRPALILKRQKPYVLQSINDIDLLLLHSENGWVNQKIMIEWLQRVLLPYVGRNNCMFLYDSFEAHISDEVLNFLRGYPNIQLGVIVGGTTSTDQPLDLKINKSFKDICRSNPFIIQIVC